MSRRMFLCITVALIAGCRPAPNPWEPELATPKEVLIQLIEAEDTRTWNTETLTPLLYDSNPGVRSRAALAAGRIGSEGAVSNLVQLLRMDSSTEVAAMAAFALGEIESTAGVAPLVDTLEYSPLLETLKLSDRKSVRAAAVEALGKIAAALPEKDDLRKRIGDAILEVLKEQKTARHYHHDVVRKALTAALRANPEGAPPVIAMYLDEAEDEDALNSLARLRAREATTQIQNMLADDTDPIVRANAARALGAATDTSAVSLLEKTMASDVDSRARVASIRALASLVQVRSAAPLVKRADALFAARPLPAGELLEIAAALGNILPNSNDNDALKLLERFRRAGIKGPEVEIALARIAPQQFLRDPVTKSASSDWRQLSATAAGLAELAAHKDQPALSTAALSMTQNLANSRKTPDQAMPDVLRALQAFKPDDLAGVMRTKLKAEDFVVRATAADILAELPESKESIAALLEALPAAMQDKQNEAALSIIGALAASKEERVTTALVQATKSQDYLIRRRAIEALKGKPEAAGLRATPVNSRNTRADYERAVARIGKSPGAVLATDKGEIVLSFATEGAPLTVDSFIQLAEANYFDGLTFHRVVPNFVIQGGDPRGDGNGGPGYAIRCEINTIEYGEYAVGMALAGKDTGGSQFFITHSRQPHLDGGYTVFASVFDGREVVRNIERGDRIRSVTILEDLSVRIGSPRME